ncbi:hypothetical protein R1flu_007997 [Riccia fluitans]|uniref:F-box/kelch-repeat protein n=1 Tax=Riccia fluitans TaxID=41844 RepID=A0ABD1YDI2_9MARC
MRDGCGARTEKVGMNTCAGVMEDGGGVSVKSQSVHISQDPEPRKRPRRTGRRDNPNVDNPGTMEAGVKSSLQSADTTPISLTIEPAIRGDKRGTQVIASRKRSPRRVASSETRTRISVAEGNTLANGCASESASQSQQGQNMGTLKPCDREQDREDVRRGDYFPAIHNELGQLCLTRVPRSKIYDLALVCKKWKAYLLGPELYKARRQQRVREDWVFILGMNADKKWRAYRPAMDDWVVIPPCPSDYTFDSCDKESMVAGLNLMVLGQGGNGYVVWRFDTIRSEWSTTPRMNTDRCLFGSASFGECAYFAGGSCNGMLLKSVERYNSETDSWELLSDMHTERKSCSGFVMDGKFYVIGGQQNSNKKISSGESYDPSTKTWTLIEDMWPASFVASSQVAPPLVAVVNNQLYAINIIENMLMSYDKQRNQWNFLEKVPHRAENTNGWGLGFKAVGDELFVIGGARGPGLFLPAIHAYSPSAEGTHRWRFVTDLRLPTSGFISNCAVMSG